MKKIVLIALLFQTFLHTAGNVYYVNQSGGNNGNPGTSWSQSFATLDVALAKTVAGDTVKVAKGTYTAPSGDGFIIPAGVYVFGAFNGTNNYDPLTQIPDTYNYETILQGNSGRVLTQKTDFIATTSSLWVGFTVQGGNASNAVYKQGNGGGAYIQAYTTVRYVKFSGNQADNGGGIYNDGGGVVANCMVTNNTATTGAGIYNHISRVFNTLVINNTATGSGGGVTLQGGGITNTTISNNQSNTGGGLYNNNTTGAVKNCIVYGNNATTYPEVYTSDYTRFYSSIIKGILPGNGTANIGSDPLFLNPGNNNYHPQVCSPAVDAGINSYITDYITESGYSGDLDGNPRIFNNKVDIGAYEYNGTYNTVTRLYVNVAQTVPGDGLSWSTAFQSLDDALNLANGNCATNQVKEIYVAKGTYIPSQNQGIGTNNRNKAFTVKKGISIYGGFTGTNNAETPATRNLAANISTLSGIIGSTGTSADSLYHVMIIAKNTGTDSVIVDGFTVMGGSATAYGNIPVNGITIMQSYGGGIYNASGATTRLSNNIIQGNAAISGAGVYNGAGAGLVINNVNLNNNLAKANGGAVWNAGNMLNISGNTQITGNMALNGGGIYNSNNAQLAITTINMSNNTAQNGGGIYGLNSAITITGTNSISGNTALLGNEIFAGTGTTLNLSGTPAIGVVASKKGIYLNNEIRTNLTSDVTGAQICFENPADPYLGRVMAAQSSPVTNSEFAAFTYLGNNYRILQSGNNVILSKLKASFINYADSTKTYNGTMQGVTAGVTPDSLSNYITYQYTGTITATGATYGPTSNPPIVPGIYKVKASLKNNATFADMDSTVTLTINPAILNVQAKTLSKTYGNPDPVLTYTYTPSLAPGDKFTGKLSRTSGENANTYPITKGTLSAGSNYTINFTGANFTINKRPLTVMADSCNKVIGSPDPPFTYSVVSGGLAINDAFAGSLTRVAGETVGTYQINQGTLGIVNSTATDITNTNYTLTFIQGGLTITAAPLLPQAITWTLPLTYTYGDPQTGLNANADSHLPVKISSDNSDVASITGGLLTITGTGTATIKAVQPGNSVYAAATPVEYLITVSPKNITITANDTSKIYGDPDPSAFNYTLSTPLIGTDSVSGILTRNPGENTGTYAITQGTLELSSNYNLTFTNGTFTINPRPLRLVVLSGTSYYGDSPVSPGIIVQNLAGQDSIPELEASTFAIDNNTAAGIYILHPAVSTTTNPNYTLTTTINGIWIVQSKPISVTANSGNSTYGDNPGGQGFTASGLVNGQTVSNLTGLNIDKTIIATTGAGTYSINVAGTLTNTNYVLAPADHIPGTWIVSPKPITVTALGGTSAFGSNPANPGFTVTGLVNGETVSVLTGLSNSFGINSTTPPGTQQLTVTGDLANPNYSLSLNDRIPGQWTVTGEQLTGIIFDDQTVEYDGTSKSIWVDNLPAGVSVVYTGNEQVDAGTYTISAHITGPNNMDTIMTATLTILPPFITVTAIGGTSVYGTTPVNPGLSATGLVNGESVDVLTELSNSFGITSSTPPGSYELNVTSDLTNKNYILPYSNRIKGIWVVTAVNPSEMMLPNLTTTYDGTSKSLAVDNLPAGATVTYTSNNQTIAGTYKVTAVVSIPGQKDTTLTATLIINKAMLLVKAKNQTMTYGTDPNKLFLVGEYDITGFVNNETENVITTKPIVKIDPSIHLSTPVGIYPGKVIVSRASAMNYDFIYTPGDLTITNIKEDMVNKLFINGQEHDINLVYQAPCSVYDLTIEIVTNPNAAIVNIGKKFQKHYDKPGVYTIPFVVTSPDGKIRKNYTLVIEEKFTFKDVIVQKWDNTLMLDIHKLKEIYGYEFVSFKWFKDNTEVGTGTYYSAGENKQDLFDDQLPYYVEMTSSDGTVLHTCPTIPVYKSQQVKAYPNPVFNSGLLSIEADLDEETLKDAIIEIQSLSGSKLGDLKISESKTMLIAPSTPGYYILRFKSKKGEQTIKLIVK